MPASPSPAFVAECKYWQLGNLLGAFRRADTQKGLFVMPDEYSFQHAAMRQGERKGFSLTGCFYHFASKWIPKGPSMCPLMHMAQRGSFIFQRVELT